MASEERIIFGQDVSEPGRYQLCWVTSDESGEVVVTRRNVVVSQHGPYFYMVFANDQFKPYACGHEGLRCDLVDPNAGWFIPDADSQCVELADDDLIRDGDFTIVLGERQRINRFWFGQSVAKLQLSYRGVRVFRPVVHDADSVGVDVQPGLQATG